MEPPPLVSLVVTTRNSSATVEACLRSLRAQAWRPVELLVVDNHSSDNTSEIANRYADAFLIAGPERSRQRNLGAQAANGEYLIFIDSDMVVPPVVSTECVSALRAGAGAVVIPEVSVGEGYWARCKAFERSLYANDQTIESPRCFTRSAFLSAGQFDEDLFAGEDWDLAARVARVGVPVIRTRTAILHDEGHLRLIDAMRAKFYYGTSIRRYIRKQPKNATQQLTPFRKAYFRHIGVLLHEPRLTAGVVVMKSLEMAAGGAGLVAGLATNSSS